MGLVLVFASVSGVENAGNMPLILDHIVLYFGAQRFRSVHLYCQDPDSLSGVLLLGVISGPRFD